MRISISTPDGYRVPSRCGRRRCVHADSVAATQHSRTNKGWGSVAKSICRFYQPPRRPSITAGVSSMIFKSASAERWRMYSRS